jgi:hypothetical protein
MKTLMIIVALLFSTGVQAQVTQQRYVVRGQEVPMPEDRTNFVANDAKSIGVITFHQRTLACGNIDYVIPWKIPGPRPASDCEWLYPGQEFAVWEINGPPDRPMKTAYCVSSMWLTKGPVECRWVIPTTRGQAEFTKD